MDKLKTAGWIVLGLLVWVGFRAGTRALFNDNTANTQGFSYTLEAFNSACVSEATKGGNVSKADATSYCTCVYDKGVAEYGTETWSSELIKADTDGFTPKMNEFVNQCLIAYKES